MAIASATKYHAGVHVEEEDLLPAAPRCPICSSAGERSRALRLQANPDIFLLSCTKCGADSASRMPREETLRRYYAHYYEHLDGTFTFKEPMAFARHVMTTAGSFLKDKSVSILDFGGGGGDLSKAIAGLILASGSDNVEIDLVDYNCDLSRTETAGVIVRPHQTLEDVRGQEFHLVLASSILEHVPSLCETMVALLSGVKSGGVFYARTSSVAPLLRIFESLRVPYDFTFPAHLHDLGQSFWEQVPRWIAAETGTLKVISSRPSVVETSFSHDPVRTLAAYALKAPWYLLGSRYRLVGGWEVVFQRTMER